MGSQTLPTEAHCALGAAAPHPPVCPSRCQALEGMGTTSGAWMPTSPCPPRMDDVRPAGPMHTAICAQACARGWGLWALRLPALEQVAPLQGGGQAGGASLACLWSVLCWAGVRLGWGGAFPLCAWPGSPCGQEAWPKPSPRSLLLPQRTVPEPSRDRAPWGGGSLQSGLGFLCPRGPPQRTRVQGHLSPAPGPGRVEKEGKAVEAALVPRNTPGH